MAELHCHLEGALPVALAHELAAKHGVPTDGLIENGRYLWSNFTEFLDVYDRAAMLIREPEDFTRLTRVYLEELAADGAIYAELFITPDHAEIAGIGYPAYLQAVADGVEQAREATGIECRFVAHVVRHFGPERAMRAVEIILSNPHPLVTGLGLAGDERLHQPRDFAPAFEAAREAGLGVTAHAGEFGGPDSVRAALDALGVSRIGHGVRAVEDHALVKRLADEGVVLEVCPGSNISLGVYAGLASHPLPKLAEEGVRVTLNSDDPPFFDTSLAREYGHASSLGFSREALLGMTRTAIEAAFVDEDTRARLSRRLEKDRA